MLPRIGCYCKIMVFSPFKLEVTYYHLSRVTMMITILTSVKTPKIHFKSKIYIIT